MPTLPIRNLGSVGVVTDVDPFNLPFNAFTRAKNVRFVDGNIQRAPAFRNLATLGFQPSFIYGLNSPGSYDTVIVSKDDLTLYEYANGSLTTVFTPVSPSSSLVPLTGTTLANVQYVNREDHVPLYRGPGQSVFTSLPNFPSDHRTQSMRSYGDFLLALGMTEAGVSYPNRVRFSDLVLANQVPSTWDASDTTNSAGFNDLVQMKTPIVDGATLGTNFLVYSSDQVWLMEFVGGTFIFNFRKVFDDAGVINKNCIVEVEGKHFVFDSDDIYVNDGITRQSICDQRVRDYIFNGLDRSKADECFTLHSKSLEEIYFCYHSGDDMAIYTNSDSCNRAAVYNYRNDTWSFMDLPNVIAGTVSNVNAVLSYATINLTYENVGGTYHEQESQYTRYPLMVSRINSADGINSSRLLALDLVDRGTLTQELATDLSTNMLLERVGIDLDEAQLPLSGYKVINRIYPQVSIINTNKEMTFRFGAANLPNQLSTYGPDITFNIDTDYKIDTRISGRYLSYQVETSDLKDFTLSGMDIDVIVTGRR